MKINFELIYNFKTESCASEKITHIINENLIKVN